MLIWEYNLKNVGCLVDWDFLSDQSMMLICCCLTSLCLQMTSGSEWKMRCLRDIRALEGAPASNHVSVRTLCLLSAMLLLPAPGLIRPAGLCYTKSIFSPLPPCWQMSVPAWSKAEMCGFFSTPSGTPLPVGEQGHSHSISFCPCLHPVTALPSAACSRWVLGVTVIYSNCSVSQL